MRVIGLTGGVGSGKSLAAELLQEICGAELLITDELGHVVMESDAEVHGWMIDFFGDQIVREDGTIDRAAVAQVVFADEGARRALEGQIHPAVIRYIRDYIEGRRESEGTIVLESAILFEAGCDSFCDCIVYIQVEEEIRRQRLVQSRGYSQEKITAILSGQMTEREFAAKCDVVIPNNAGKEQLREHLVRWCGSISALPC